MPSNCAFARPVKTGLVKALNTIREKGRRSCQANTRQNLTGRESVVLGRLIYNWKDIVGLQLATKTCPARLIKGRLYLTVSDSQWMQTLLFLRTNILDKLRERFPDIKINEIVGRPGVVSEQVKKMVEEANWPDWQNETANAPDNITDDEVKETIIRCKQKTQARLKGLEKRGYILCEICESSLTRSEQKICAVCMFNQNRQKFFELKNLIREMPWLNYEEISEISPLFDAGEIAAIRSLLFEEICELIEDLARTLKAGYVSKVADELRKEITRALMLDSCCMPDEVDLHALKPDQILDAQWPEYISLTERDESSC